MRTSEGFEKMKKVFCPSDLNGKLVRTIAKLTPWEPGKVRFIHFHENQAVDAEGKEKKGFLKILQQGLDFGFPFGYDYAKHCGYTIAVAMTGMMGVSLCSRQDRWNRKRGNRIAKERLKKFLLNHNMECGKEIQFEDMYEDMYPEDRKNHTLENAWDRNYRLTNLGRKPINRAKN